MTTRTLRVDPFSPSKLRTRSKQVGADPVFLEKCAEETEERVAVDLSNSVDPRDKLVGPIKTLKGFPKMVDIRASGRQSNSRAVHHFVQKIIENDYTLNDRRKIVEALSTAMSSSLHKYSQSVLENIVKMHLSLFNESKTKEEVCKSIADTFKNEQFTIETITFEEWKSLRSKINFTLNRHQVKNKTQWTAKANEDAPATWVVELGKFTQQLFNPLTGLIVSCTQTYVSNLIERANDMRNRMVASRSSSAASTNVARTSLRRYEQAVFNLKHLNYHTGNRLYHELAWTIMKDDMLSTDDLKRTSVQTFPKLSGRTCDKQTLPTAREVESHFNDYTAGKIEGDLQSLQSTSFDQLDVFRIVVDIVYIMSHGSNPPDAAERVVEQFKQKVLQLDHRLGSAPLEEQNNFVFEDLIDRLNAYAAAEEEVSQTTKIEFEKEELFRRNIEDAKKLSNDLEFKSGEGSGSSSRPTGDPSHKGKARRSAPLPRTTPATSTRRVLPATVTKGYASDKIPDALSKIRRLIDEVGKEIRSITTNVNALKNWTGKSTPKSVRKTVAKIEASGDKLEIHKKSADSLEKDQQWQSLRNDGDLHERVLRFLDTENQETSLKVIPSTHIPDTIIEIVQLVSTKIESGIKKALEFTSGSNPSPESIEQALPSVLKDEVTTRSHTRGSKQQQLTQDEIELTVRIFSNESAAASIVDVQTFLKTLYAKAKQKNALTLLAPYVGKRVDSMLVEKDKEHNNLIDAKKEFKRLAGTLEVTSSKDTLLQLQVAITEAWQTHKDTLGSKQIPRDLSELEAFFDAWDVDSPSETRKHALIREEILKSLNESVSMTHANKASRVEELTQEIEKLEERSYGTKDTSLVTR